MQFFVKIHPNIQYPYILITIYIASSMDAFKDDPKIIAWFGNCTDYMMRSEKFIPIPLGVLREERLFYQREEVNSLFSSLQRTLKEKFLYMNFSLPSWQNFERIAVYELFKDKIFCTNNIINYQNQRKDFFDFIQEMAHHKFTLSPAGDMLDCYRHWEALLVGSIPIVKSSCLDCLFEDLPVLIIHDWHEITEEFLNRKYHEIKKGIYDFRKLYMKYWVDKIHAIKAEFFNSYLGE